MTPPWYSVHIHSHLSLIITCTMLAALVLGIPNGTVYPSHYTQRRQRHNIVIYHYFNFIKTCTFYHYSFTWIITILAWRRHVYFNKGMWFCELDIFPFALKSMPNHWVLFGRIKWVKAQKSKHKWPTKSKKYQQIFCSNIFCR